MLAVTIGNVHGKYAQAPVLDFPRLAAISNELARLPSVPHLVLHGASGLPASMITGARQHGIVKFNVNTDVRTAALDFYRNSFHQSSGDKVRVSQITLSL